VPLRKIVHIEAGTLAENNLPKPKNVWRKGLLVLTSAALGGIAVAIWNRRTLAQIREQSDANDRGSTEEGN
jgi:hypothetical protein